MALQLGQLCGNGPEFRLRMQMLRDLWCLQRTLAADLARIPTYRARYRETRSGQGTGATRKRRLFRSVLSPLAPS
jgi:hypothetical protein